MKNSQEEIDALIKETLNEEEAKFYDELDEQGLIGMVSGLFRGKLKWILVMMNIVHLASIVGLVYCIIQFVHTDVTNELIKWGALGFVLLMVGAMLKLFTWLQMDKNAIMRELKRLELQVAILSEKRQVN